LSSVVNLVLALPQTRQLKEVILQNLGPLLFHVDLFRVPVTKLAKVDPTLSLWIFGQSQDTVAIGTRETERTFAVLDR
jgi:hypothetical protein